MSGVKFLHAGLFAAVVAVGASALAWVPSRTATGLAMSDSDGSGMSALADSDGGVPTPLQQKKIQHRTMLADNGCTPSVDCRFFGGNY